MDTFCNKSQFTPQDIDSHLITSIVSRLAHCTSTAYVENRYIKPLLAGPVTLEECPHVVLLHLFSRPRGLAQKGKARVNTRIVDKTLYLYLLPKPGKAIVCNQFFYYHLERDSVERVVFLSRFG